MFENSGRLERVPKKAKIKQQVGFEMELTKAINKENEQRFAGVAANNGGQLAILRAPPPEIADADGQKNKKKSKEVSKRASMPWGASSKG